MVLNYYSQPDGPERDGANLKDSRCRTIMVGCVLPACVLAIVVADFAAGRVIMSAGHWQQGNVLGGFLQAYPLGWSFAGVITMKTALAAALFSWYALANHAPTERHAQPALFGSIVLFVLGLIVYAASFIL